ncbi:MAG: UDP-N-acetylglucosamine 2-epimerase (non-hydrolyzing) [Solirubrobacterales bacterium]|nr:UDP-N-acetylglucosamine 2-epimerase (non-hydrolyzing) [Solirubrobacterales bacterium]HMT05127.1 UDP-N-acetylglucosamine 2-epimerase (non-hydrolyzing) [Solirubrobacterales bacterium]
MRIVHVLGTRPNFVKMAPLIAAISRRMPGADQTIVHTGQHYDRLMSEIFFEQLGVPAPDHMLEVGSGTHAQQTARVMERLEPLLVEDRPDLVVVPGDVNSTLAAALTAVKLEIPVAHLESGLRSYDRTMPEEINRIVTDQISDTLWVHSEEALRNLELEGIPAERAHFVGNTMIDSLVALQDRFRPLEACRQFGLEPGSYLLVTLHRPALVDGPLLFEAVAALNEVSGAMPVLFPVHPRTRARLAGNAELAENLHLVDPAGYLEFLSLEADAGAVLTDSGGIQEETSYLGVPCFTLRDNTERPVTIELGTNTLLGLDPARISEIPSIIAARNPSAPPPQPPPLWDGHAADRIAEQLARMGPVT